MSVPHILIVGGGIGGLALAQNLKKRGISFTLFERDASPAIRAQGYRIRIAGGGVEGLKECLDDELFNLESMFPMGPGGRPGVGQGPSWLKMGGSGRRGGRINKQLRPAPILRQKRRIRRKREIVAQSQQEEKLVALDKSYPVDRTMLRNILLLGQEENVKFSKCFTHYEVSAVGVTAFFDDGTSEEGTLLVGADGTASLVRRQLLPNVHYLDTGSRVIYGKTPISEELVAQFPADPLKGTSIIQDQRPFTLFMEPVRFPKDAAMESKGRLPRTDDYIYWVLGGNAEAVGLSDEEFHNLSEKDASDLTLKLTTHWDPSFKAMFELQHIAQCAPLRLISAKRERPEWTPSPKVILIGDAIHAMMPAGGSGANCALADASHLARHISERGISEETMACFVDQMFDYALPAIDGSAQAGKKLLGFKDWEGAKEVTFN
ncbi:putative FAD-dependent monooxygenase [Lachnellula suecica]|uniref:Putative FAD-dependent monooxygenase n=1 Tax=Lachnellula suecica TaxID=602035 RepID=A0A8T9CCH9_9HELO|nr:putative FAD-dependent monooxygenase [Lachnellula suecica]